MEIYLFRHGIAEDAPPGRPDSARALTADGRRRTAAVARLARHSGVAPSLIVSSPYVRAVQTAEVAASEFGYQDELVKLISLVPQGTPEAVWSDLRDFHDQSAVLLAGHEPLLANLAAYLLNAPGLVVEMKKSAMVRIDVAALGPAPRGVMRWMIVPKLA